MDKKLCELEMLMSMYSKNGELTLDDPSCYTDLKTLVNDELVLLKNGVENVENNTISMSSSQIYNKRLRYTVKLESVEKNKFEITFDLPSDYPFKPPDISLRSDALKTKEVNNKLFNELHHYMRDSLTQSEPIVLDIIQWVSEHIDHFANIDEKIYLENTQKSRNETIPEKSETLCRLWIYSHHIYNKTKRKTILELAKDLNLDGFSSAGKPGIICVEGCRRNTEEFWLRIRSLQWQKILVKHQEICDGSEENWKKFSNFEEKCFQAPHCKDGHTDTGLLLEFLTTKNCQYVFPIYFGVAGNINQEK